MQLSAMRGLLLGALVVAQVRAAVFLRASLHERVMNAQAAASSAYRAEWAALIQVETDDQQFWSDEWAAMETELLQLQTIASTDPAKNSSANASKAAAPANATAMVKLPLASNATAPVQNASANHAAHDDRHHSLLKGIKLKLNPKTPMDLLPTLAMLKGMYEDGKDRIAKLNAREKKSKQQFAEKETRHKAKIQTIEDRFKNHTLSEEFRTNETRDENRIWSYWQRVRERQHRQFHTSLKIQHATLEKVKVMIDMYTKTIDGTADKAQVRKQLAQASGGMPDVVLLEEAQKATVVFCQEALVEVREGRAELRSDSIVGDKTILLQTS